MRLPILALLVAGSVSAQQLSFSYNPLNYTTTWRANLQQVTLPNITLGSTLGGTLQSTYGLGFFIDDSPAQGNRPAGLIINGSGIKLGRSFVREGAVASSADSFGDNAVFSEADPFLKNGAVEGTDNFLAFRLSSSMGGNHYGFLQYELHAFSDGVIAARLINIQASAIRDASFTAAAAVPEPSTYGLILGGLALAGAALRRHQRAK